MPVMRGGSIAISLALAGIASSVGHADAAVPADAKTSPQLAFTGYVVDQAAIIDAATRQRLTDRLGRFERETGHQLAIVTVTSLGGEDIAVFTRRLANRWGVGRKGFDDGIVLLVAPRDRKVRIAVGYGLERALPDAFCAAIITQAMVPAFSRGAMGQGIEAGVSALTGRFSPGVAPR